MIASSVELLPELNGDFIHFLQGAHPELKRDLSAAMASFLLAKNNGSMAEPEPALPVWEHYTLSAGLQLPPTKYLVYGAIAEGDTGMIYGDASAGKTYLAIDLAVCLAAGLPWMGQWATGQPRRVLYFISEGRRQFIRRVLASVNGMAGRGANVADVYRLVDKNLIICPDVPQLFAKDSKRSASSYLDFWKQQGQPDVDFIVIDTLHRASVGAEENSSMDAGVVIDTVINLQKCMGGAAAALIHHSNKSGGYRGSSAYRGDVDFCFKVEGNYREPRTLTVDKLRDGEPDGLAAGNEKTAVFEIDNISGQTFTTWVEGNTDKRQTKREAVQDTILRLINEGVNTQNAIVANVTMLSQNSVRSVLKNMETAGLLGVKPGPNNSKVYYVK